MVNIFEILIVGFMVLIIFMTFYTEPKLSFEYYKAAGKSVGAVVTKVKTIISNFGSDNEEAKDVEGDET